MCSYCIVPFTRGKERSRPITSILDEVKHLVDVGVREITLLGQNVNSYRDTTEGAVHSFGGLSKGEPTRLAPGFSSIYRPKTGGVRFADLLSRVADVHSELRVRFVSPHPKDFPLEVLQLVAERPNICKLLHLPAQSGSSKVLQDMRRGYTREAYLDLVETVRNTVPGVSLSTDMIAGFCGETEQEFEETVTLIEQVKYHKMFMFPYSLREKTHAHRRLEDNVPEEIKSARFQVLYDLHRKQALELNQELVGTNQVVLVEKDSKRSSDWFQGRTDGGIRVNFPKESSFSIDVGSYCLVGITGATSQSLTGKPIAKTSLEGKIVNLETEKCDGLAH